MAVWVISREITMRDTYGSKLIVSKVDLLFAPVKPFHRSTEGSGHRMPRLDRVVVGSERFPGRRPSGGIQ